MVRFCPFLTPFFLVGPFSSNHRSNHRLPKETPFDLALSGERHLVGSRTKVLTQHLCEGKGNKGLPFYDVSGEEAALLSFYRIFNRRAARGETPFTGHFSAGTFSPTADGSMFTGGISFDSDVIPRCRE